MQATVSKGVSKEALKGLVQTAASLEKVRVAMGNRLGALERGADMAEDPTEAVYSEIQTGIERLEELIDLAVEDAVNKFPVYNLWLRHVKGIGPALAAQMLAFLLPPKDGLGVGTWYKASGLYSQYREEQDMWRLPRDREGEQAHHHRYLRRCLYNVAKSFVRIGGFYRSVYDDQKGRLIQKHWPPDLIETLRIARAAPEEGQAKLLEGVSKRGAALGWTLLRLDQTARVITVKLFMSHLWHKWAEIEGVAIRPPYVIEVLGHKGYIPPPEPSGNGKI